MGGNQQQRYPPSGPAVNSAPGRVSISAHARGQALPDQSQIFESNFDNNRGRGRGGHFQQRGRGGFRGGRGGFFQQAQGGFPVQGEQFGMAQQQTPRRFNNLTWQQTPTGPANEGFTPGRRPSHGDPSYMFQQEQTPLGRGGSPSNAADVANTGVNDIPLGPSRLSPEQTRGGFHNQGQRGRGRGGAGIRFELGNKGRGGVQQFPQQQQFHQQQGQGQGRWRNSFQPANQAFQQQGNWQNRDQNFPNQQPQRESFDLPQDAPLAQNVFIPEAHVGAQAVLSQQTGMTDPVPTVMGQPDASVPQQPSLPIVPIAPSDPVVPAPGLMGPPTIPAAAPEQLADVAANILQNAEATAVLRQSGATVGTKRSGDDLPDRPAKEARIDTSALTRPRTRREGVYDRIGQVGEGTYGKVYKATNTLTREVVALKKIRMENERDGFPVTAVREIRLLQSLKHRNVVQLLEMMVEKSSVYMVFEYMDHDLSGVLANPNFKFETAHIKHLCKQMLEGLEYLHLRGVLHRDIKGSNILLSNSGELKIADFGLARFFHRSRKAADYTNRVITLWYRPPELLLGATAYGSSVDVWSAGCIMLELYKSEACFKGQDEISQLEIVYDVMGTPTPETWSDADKLPWFELLRPKEAKTGTFQEVYSRLLSPTAMDLAGKLLSLDPAKRPTCTEALQHPYFTTEAPAPSPPVGLGEMVGDWHEFESKQRKRQERKEKERLERQVSGSRSGQEKA
ncbi:Pkinase-domain-containing protein [Saitoella complicata NRRL Y-17804]|uniref:Pkinase-domain-containing protein n=1 Tax=Saitoella complicata (strain BCRC 22490 / CBS 7301 / JCM 7358 / NBRC 10748 / NRRL Y-17804) TaxID=698492 RepID=UPI0008671E7F|nr:Pkinase-domain-containing protein [Saitoella complicata NRRL Y-17804]ODQ54034.1 Pkinase-domain-containing protein [Saitoella complicata NRRL Y-17804]